MLATALVIFREILEIAIILSVVLAATVGVPNRARFMLLGIGLGVVGSALIALFAQEIAGGFDGIGQEIMNAIILGLATLMICWTVVWMKTHAREITQSLREMGANISSGATPVKALVLVIALAVFREGAEIVLFSMGILSSGMSYGAYAAGVVLGTVGGVVVGFMIYLGLITISTRHIFTVSSWLLALVAAGMAAKAVGYLSAADIVPELGGVMWDTSNILAGNSLVGETLGVLIGYNDAPTGVQVLAYVSVIIVMAALLKLTGRPAPKPTKIA